MSSLNLTPERQFESNPDSVRRFRRNQEINNPCLKEHKLSLQCLDENSYEQSACSMYFDNYKICKEFWNDVQQMRRRQGIRPYLPPPEERDKIKEEYLKSKNQ